MIGQACIIFAVPPHPLLFILFKGTLDTLDPVFKNEFPINQKKISGMSDGFRIGAVKIGFGECQVMDGIKQIGLPHSIVSYKAVDLRRELNIEFSIRFKIDQV
jgi:hypothetical protein